MNNDTQWNQARVEAYIANGVEESLTLDYKEARAFDSTDGKKREITKDVSAMANSAGGIIIYGVAEYQDEPRKHLPERIDPINRTQFSKEWLDQVIGNIQPRIDGVVVHPVPIQGMDANAVVYVVEIPQSHTAHQARDHRYYKRFNFESKPMEDYEIRDVMGRGQHPRIYIQFEIEVSQTLITNHTGSDSRIIDKSILKIRAYNAGLVLAHYVNAFVCIPAVMLPNDSDEYTVAFQSPETIDRDGTAVVEVCVDNTTRDIVGFRTAIIGPPRPSYGPARYEPILPRLYSTLKELDLASSFYNSEHSGITLQWEVYADSAPPISGVISLTDVPISHRQTRVSL